MADARLEGMKMPFADLTDARMYYELTGEGEPLVLVPGLGHVGEAWEPIAALLSEYFAVICLDNRGMGRSVALRQPRTVRDYAADLIELLDHLQVKQAHVLGISLGGVIAQRLAVDHPGRIARLVLVSCTYTFTPYLREVARLIAQTLRWRPRAVFARTMEVLGTSPTIFDEYPQRIKERVEQMRQLRVSSRAVIRQLAALGASKVEPDEYRILASTLVISGEFDTLIPHCYGRRMANLIEDSQFIMLPESGHNPFTDCPDKVLPLVVKFLQDGKVSSFNDLRDTTRQIVHDATQTGKLTEIVASHMKSSTRSDGDRTMERLYGRSDA